MPPRSFSFPEYMVSQWWFSLAVVEQINVNCTSHTNWRMAGKDKSHGKEGTLAFKTFFTLQPSHAEPHEVPRSTLQSV